MLTSMSLPQGLGPVTTALSNTQPAYDRSKSQDTQAWLSQLRPAAPAPVAERNELAVTATPMQDATGPIPSAETIRPDTAQRAAITLAQLRDNMLTQDSADTDNALPRPATRSSAASNLDIACAYAFATQGRAGGLLDKLHPAKPQSELALQHPQRELIPRDPAPEPRITLTL